MLDNSNLSITDDIFLGELQTNYVLRLCGFTWGDHISLKTETVQQNMENRNFL